jgi:hypothetical protein
MGTGQMAGSINGEGDTKPPDNRNLSQACRSFKQHLYGHHCRTEKYQDKSAQEFSKINGDALLHVFFPCIEYGQIYPSPQSLGDAYLQRPG